MAQPAFLSSLRSRLRSPAPPSPHSRHQPSRGYHVELGAREKALLEEDVALKRFKSYKNSVKQVSKVGNVLTLVVAVAFACGSSAMAASLFQMAGTARFRCADPDLPFQIGRHVPADSAACETPRTDKEPRDREETTEEQRSPVMATKAWAAAAALNPHPLRAVPSSSPVQLGVSARRTAPREHSLRSSWQKPVKFVCRRAKNAGFDDYKFPDPIPEFAEQETSKFREHMAWRLEQKKDDYFGEHVEEIVDICTQACNHYSEDNLLAFLQFTNIWLSSKALTCDSFYWQILGSFLEHDYCGPGTLLVHPFLDMKGEIKERGLPGAPQAARAAIAWAEKNIDKDWKAWTGEY
ncbi:hypothetical protein PR202_gb22738 [Eleusine coracana subsp. coracana]|uniref:Uncharacterized protein n=1 Tax=Eleusine coracana subsp. coracana TaxID=191504 RepID=A0AAV5FH58_ELECO|nr:hypothetical protein PR202_gb22738 [Eleusine coracana subsp. coracana]